MTEGLAMPIEENTRISFEVVRALGFEHLKLKN